MCCCQDIQNIQDSYSWLCTFVASPPRSSEFEERMDCDRQGSKPLIFVADDQPRFISSWSIQCIARCLMLKNLINHATETPLIIINCLPFLKMAVCPNCPMDHPDSDQWDRGHPWFFEIESTNNMFIWLLVKTLAPFVNPKIAGFHGCSSH